MGGGTTKFVSRASSVLVQNDLVLLVFLLLELVLLSNPPETRQQYATLTLSRLHDHVPQARIPKQGVWRNSDQVLVQLQVARRPRDQVQRLYPRRGGEEQSSRPLLVSTTTPARTGGRLIDSYLFPTASPV